MKILIFGKGQMSGPFTEYYESKGHTVHSAEGADITKIDDIRAAIKQYQPDTVINLAAKTYLDWCEKNKLECFHVNVLGADNVAAVCQEAGAYLLHVSTGCMQESLSENDLHKEEDPVNPTSFYSWTKHWADEMILVRAQRSNLKALILRPRQPSSAKASHLNSFVKMLTFPRFIDTPNSMTILEDFIEVSEKMLMAGITGLYNVANPGVLSPYKVALLLKEYVKPDMVVEKMTKDELNRLMFARRIDSALDTSKLERMGFGLRPATERLREILPLLKAELEAHPEILEKAMAQTKEKLSYGSK